MKILRNHPASLDVVIPVFNEQEVIALLFAELERVFTAATLSAEGISSIRFLFIDDGSKDDTSLFIKKKIDSGSPAALYRFSRNFGHQAAISAGMHFSRSDITAFIDADLQDPPEVILALVKKWREGADVVHAERQKRKESVFKRLCYWGFYRLLDFLTDIDIALDSGDFCLLDRKVVQAISALPEKLRFPRGLRSWVGFTQGVVIYDRQARQAGESKYPFRKLLALATNGIASLSVRPLKVSQFFCFVFSLFLLGFSILSIQKYLTYAANREMALWFLLSYSLTALSSLMLMLGMYIQSSYIGRIYLEVKGRPTFLVMESLGKGTEAVANA